MATKTSAQKAVDMANSIRTLAGESFQSVVPVATRSNIGDFSSPILSISNIRNMFVDTLVQRIAFEFVHAKTFKNPLARFKKGSTPLGGIVQEIATNPVKDQGFSSDGYITLADGTVLTPLNKRTPDTKTLYHTITRESQYPISISRQQLQTAFTSWENLDNFISSIMNAMYSGDSIDEFIYTKNLVDTGVSRDMLVTEYVENPMNGEEAAKKFVVAMNTRSSKMRFPSTKYNRYIEMDGASGEAFKTWSDKDRQVVILRSDVLNYINIEVLAQSFNMTKADFQNSVVEVDEFSNPSILGVVCDESLFQIYDNLFEVTEQQNAQGLFFTYFLTHFQTLSLSLLANCTVFMDSALASHSIVATVTPQTSGYSVNVAKKANKGETVSYTVDAVDYSKASIAYSGISDEPPKTLKKGEKYSFVMGDEDVTITLTVSE